MQWESDEATSIQAWDDDVAEIKNHGHVKRQRESAVEVGA